jgi:hypothetical protein
MRSLFLIPAVLIPAVVQGQISGYASATRSTNSNPLYNYEMLSDGLTEGYWELARSILLGGDVSMDLTLSVSALRNQSNDSYNDYSVRSFGVSLGIGW